MSFSLRPHFPRRSGVYITAMRVDPVSRPCFVYCKALWINARLGSDAEGSHVDRMSQQITSSSVYVSVAVGAARHVSPAVTIDLRLTVVQCLCVSRKPSVGEVGGDQFLTGFRPVFVLFVRNKLTVLLRLLFFHGRPGATIHHVVSLNKLSVSNVFDRSVDICAHHLTAHTVLCIVSTCGSPRL